MANKKQKETKITPTGRIVFHKNLFQPDDKENYKVTILFNKEQDLSELKRLQNEAGLEKFTKEEMSDETFKKGLKPANSKQKRKYEFMDDDTIVLNANSKYPIAVKGSNKGPDGKLEDLFDQDIVAGDYVRAIVSAASFDVDTNQGVKFYVSGIQKVKSTEEPLYKPQEVDEVFGAVEFDVAPETSSASPEELGDDW